MKHHGDDFDDWIGFFGFKGEFEFLLAVCDLAIFFAKEEIFRLRSAGKNILSNRKQIIKSLLTILDNEKVSQ